MMVMMVVVVNFSLVEKWNFSVCLFIHLQSNGHSYTFVAIYNVPYPAACMSSKAFCIKSNYPVCFFCNIIHITVPLQNWGKNSISRIPTWQCGKHISRYTFRWAIVLPISHNCTFFFTLPHQLTLSGPLASSEGVKLQWPIHNYKATVCSSSGLLHTHKHRNRCERQLSKWHFTTSFAEAIMPLLLSWYRLCRRGENLKLGKPIVYIPIFDMYHHHHPASTYDWQAS